jgi:hypothetical protein
LPASDTFISIEDLATHVHELAAVRWDADVVPHDLPMKPRPRLYLQQWSQPTLVFGPFGGSWSAIAVWCSGSDPIDHDHWEVRRPLVPRGLGYGNDRIAAHVDTQKYRELLRVASAVKHYETTEENVYEGANGTPRDKKDVSPNSRLKASLGDLAKFTKRGE